jgi:branched-subunit amino acid aminotransferase/4-amino-4-deoxychorismate lyase
MKQLSPEVELQRIDRFRRVAGGRANKALEHIERLITTADRSRYSYTDDQVAEVVSKLRQAVDQVEIAYSQKRRLRVEL